jgi:glycosyltransferase involved in cell wall biosynthesis
MRILIIISDFSVGGAEKVAASLSNGLHAEGNSVTLLSFNSFKDNYILRNISADIRKVSLKKETIPGWRFLIRLTNFLVLRNSYDIIIAHLHPVAYYLGLIVPILNMPVIYVIHNEYSKLNNPVKQRIIRKFYRSRKVRLVAVSDRIRDHFIKNFDTFPLLIRNGINKPAVSENVQNVKDQIEGYKFSKETVVLTAIQRIVWFKNLPALARSVSEVSKMGKELILLIIGDDPTKNQAEINALREIGSENVFLLGAKENIGDYLVNSDCFCLVSSDFEGYPIALLEAISLGLPVIASRVGGIPSIITDSVNGILCEPTVDSIKEAVLHFLEMTLAEKERMRESNLLLFSEKFKESQMISQYKDLITELQNPPK